MPCAGAVCLLAMSRSDRQYGCSVRGSETWRGPKEDNQMKNIQKSTLVDTGMWYLVLCSMHGTALYVCSNKSSAARHITAVQGTAGTHGAALPSYVLLGRAELEVLFLLFKNAVRTNLAQQYRYLVLCLE